MPCLEGKETNLTEKDVQIEVEKLYSETDSHVPTLTELDQNENSIIVETENNQSSDTDEQTDFTNPPLNEYQLTRDRERRQIRTPARFDCDDFVSLFTYHKQFENKQSSCDDAINCKDAKNWIAAMNNEMSSLLKNNT